MKAVASGYNLDISKFKEFCDETFLYIMKHYPWYVMPPTVHKLLVHGFVIADYFDLPLGAYSEEALEAQNKTLRKARLEHTSKISRLNVTKNQFTYMLVRTDPIISSISFKKHKNIDGER